MLLSFGGVFFLLPLEFLGDEDVKTAVEIGGGVVSCVKKGSPQRYKVLF